MVSNAVPIECMPQEELLVTLTLSQSGMSDISIHKKTVYWEISSLLYCHKFREFCSIVKLKFCKSITMPHLLCSPLGSLPKIFFLK